MKEYTIKEAAELLELSTSTIRRRIKSGQLEANKKETKFGPQYFIPGKEINRATSEEEVVEVKETTQPVPIEDFKNNMLRAVREQNEEMFNHKFNELKEELIEARERQNEHLVEEVTSSMEKIINQQNEVIEDLQEKVEKVEEENSKNPVVKFLEWLYY